MQKRVFRSQEAAEGGSGLSTAEVSAVSQGRVISQETSVGQIIPHRLFVKKPQVVQVKG